jgi:parallel beta-helix repeat protein
MTGSCPDGRDCGLPRMSRVSAALLSLACAILMCGLAGAAEYGEINITPTNCDQWSTNLSNNDSRVAGDIIVNDGAVLSIENATIRMERYYSGGWKYPSIIVRENGTLNVNDSTITRYNYYYGWRYESGSRGNVTNSTVTFCIYNNGFKIETNETVSLFNVTFDHGEQAYSSNCYGIYLNSANYVNIRDCTIKTSSTQSYSNRRYTYGIYTNNSNYCNLSDNIIEEKSSYNHGMYIQNSQNNTLNNISITRGAYSSTSHDAVHLESSFNNTLRDFSIAGGNNKHGIHAYSSNNISVINSTINGVRDHGIYIQNSNYCNISENNVTDSGDYGIYIQNSENATLLSNDLDRNRDGMNFEFSTNSTLTGNTITDSSEYGINITSSQGSILRSNGIINGSVP